jgi:hypothetical protein
MCNGVIRAITEQISSSTDWFLPRLAGRKRAEERNAPPSVAEAWFGKGTSQRGMGGYMKQTIGIAALGLALILSMATTSWAQGAGGGAGGATGGAAAGTGSAGGGVGNSPGASANKAGQGGATTGNKARSGVGNH